MERQQCIADGNKNKTLAINFLTDAISCFEDLSNDILYEIFDFLDFCQACDAFTPLNQRFQNLFTHCNLPIKIKLTSISRSTFSRYNKRILMPNLNCIKSLHMSNPFVIDHMLPSLSNGLKLTQLETLILEKIQWTILKNLLKSPLPLSYLSSLIIDCEDLVENRKNLYEEIFRFPRLKYCKLSINEYNRSEPLPLATNQFSSIEHFILITKDSLYDLPHLLSYMPHLKKLSIQSNGNFSPEQMQQSSSVLLHLTHLSLTNCNIPFNLLSLMVESLFNQVEVFHFSTSSKNDYIDADQWESLIASNMPRLRIFDLNVKFTLDWNHMPVECNSRIKQFHLPFWSERQWFFQSEIHKMRYKYLLYFFSTNPYR